MKLDNLKIGFLGDSITQGWGASKYECCFVSLFEQNHPEAKIYNYGIGGTRLANQTSDYNKDYDTNPFYTRLKIMEDDLDIIVVLGGVNDYEHGDAPMGSFLDKDYSTFYGAINSLILDLKKKYPKSYLLFLSPMKTAFYQEKRKKLDGNGYQLIDYVKAIRETTEYHHVDFIDLWNLSGITDGTFEKLTFDGEHPNDLGYKIMFEIINKYFMEL